MKTLPSLTKETVSAFVAATQGKTINIKVEGSSGGYYGGGIVSDSFAGFKECAREIFTPAKMSCTKEAVGRRTERILTLENCNIASVREAVVAGYLGRQRDYSVQRVGHRVGIIHKPYNERRAECCREYDDLNDALKLVFSVLPEVGCRKSLSEFDDTNDCILNLDFGWTKWNIARASLEIETLCRAMLAKIEKQWAVEKAAPDALDTFSLGAAELPSSYGLAPTERVTFMEAGGTFYGFVR